MFVHLSDLLVCERNKYEILQLLEYSKNLSDLQQLFISKNIEFSIHISNKINLDKYINIKDFLIFLDEKLMKIKEYIKKDIKDRE